MIKKTLNQKVFEIAIRKKDHTFLAKHLLDLLDDIGWSHSDVLAFTAKLEATSSKR